MMFCMENPGLNIARHLFHTAPSVVKISFNDVKGKNSPSQQLVLGLRTVRAELRHHIRLKCRYHRVREWPKVDVEKAIFSELRKLIHHEQWHALAINVGWVLGHGHPNSNDVAKNDGVTRNHFLRVQ